MTSCYQLTIAGFPSTRDDLGSSCPTTTTDSAADGGIWFDGEARYDIDGQFILDLAEIYDDPTWKLYDDDGNVLSTDTSEEFSDLVTGAPQDDADAGLSTSVSTARSNGPMAAGRFPPPWRYPSPQSWATNRRPLAQRSAPSTGCSDSTQAVADGETPLFGYALDGYPIHAPYEPRVEADAVLDERNGHQTTELGYHYHANQVEENAVLTCFSGETTEAATGGPGGGRGAPPNRPATPRRQLITVIAGRHTSRRVGQPFVELVAKFIGVVVSPLPPAGQSDPCCRHACCAGQAENLPESHLKIR